MEDGEIIRTCAYNNGENRATKVTQYARFGDGKFSRFRRINRDQLLSIPGTGKRSSEYGRVVLVMESAALSRI